MHKGWKIVFGLFLLLVLALTFLEATEPEPVNLNPSYTSVDKIPLGSYAFFESWKDTREITEIGKPPFEVLAGEEPPEGIYFFLNDHVVFDKNELEKLLSWVGEGNTAFISAGYISENLLDTLNINAETEIRNMDFKTRPGLQLNQDSLAEEKFRLNFDIEALVFSKTDSLEHQILGNAVFNSEEKINFLQTRFGKGEIYLHSTPEAFSNYFLLQQENHRYVEQVLSHLDPAKPLLWDSYYKSGKRFYTSPLYYLLGDKTLKWAYYFALAGSILFIIFEGKRRQRPIPVIKPLKNQSYEFTKTLSQLYLEQKRYKELALRKIELFLEQVRNEYRLSTGEIYPEFYSKLAARTGNSEANTRALFKKIEQVKNQEKIGKEEFLELSRAIATYKNPDHGTTGE